MRQPEARGSAIDADRFDNWINEFAGYRDNINTNYINRWLQQFDNGDRELAARVLDSIDFFADARISSGLREALNTLPGWHRDERKRQGKWVFVPFTGSAGASGDSMLYKFRLANNLDAKRYDALFLYRRDLVSLDFSADDSVVFVDDFSGTGNTAVGWWEEHYRELLVGDPNLYLIVVAASRVAIQRVRDNTPLSVVTTIHLTERDALFSDRCRHFTPDEKARLLAYCQRADRRAPKGYGDCGFVVVFAHRCPNNSIPLLHARNGQWRGLFPRI